MRVSATVERSLSNWSSLHTKNSTSYIFAAENLVCSHVGIAKFIKVFDHTGLFADSLVQVEHQMLLMR